MKDEADVDVAEALPEGWALATMAEIGMVDLGRQRSPENHQGPHMRPYLRAANVTWNGIDLSDVLSMNFDEADFERYALASGDVLINEGSGSAAEVGKPVIWRSEIEGCCFQNTLLRVRPTACTSEYVHRYLLHAAKSRRFVPSTQGVNIFHIGKAGLARFPIPVPPLPEQRRIVAKLDGLSARSAAARRHLARIAALAARAKQAILAAAFASADPAASVTEMIAAPIRNGLSIRGSDDPPGVPALRLSALRGGTVDLSDVRFLPLVDADAQRYALRGGDVLISRGNGNRNLVGIASVVPPPRSLVIFPDTAFRIRLSPEAADSRWFAFMWSAPQAREQIERLAKTTAGIWKVSQENLRAVRLPDHDRAEQREIVRRIEAAFARIDRLADESARAARLLDRLDERLLAKAFRGEVVPQDAADEPAAALLARLRDTRAATPKRGRGRPRKGAA